MKTFKIVLISAICFIAVAIYSCNKDNFSYNATTNIRPCDAVACSNGGVCVNGNCQCPDGFEGQFCELKWNARYTGNFQGSDKCIPNSLYPVSISAATGEPNAIFINSLFTTCNAALKAQIGSDKTSFQIPNQFLCDSTYVSGVGTQTLDKAFINIYIELRDSVNHSSKSCSVELRRN